MNPVKIVLGSTEVSLHDRFSALLKEQHADLQENEKATASLRNQRLAQEMARRPSVVAALRRPTNINRWRGRMSVRERLGQQSMRAPRVMRSLQVMGRMHDSGFLKSAQQGQDCLNWTGPLRGTGGSYWSVGQSQPHGDNWTSSRPLPSREQLDQQLDEYMSQSKSHLDAELDEYMAQVDVDETG